MELLSTYALSTVLVPLAVSLLLFFAVSRKWNGRSNPSPPMAATVVGHILNFKRIHDFLAHNHQRYKTFRIAYPTFSYVFTVDPPNVEHILKTNFTNYGRVCLPSFFSCLWDRSSTPFTFKHLQSHLDGWSKQSELRDKLDSFWLLLLLKKI